MVYLYLVENLEEWSNERWINNEHTFYFNIDLLVSLLSLEDIRGPLEFESEYRKVNNMKIREIWFLILLNYYCYFQDR